MRQRIASNNSWVKMGSGVFARFIARFGGWRIGAVLALVAFLTACLSEAEKTGTQPETTLLLTAQIPDAVNSSPNLRAVNNTAPAAVTSIIIRVLTSGTEIASGDLVASGWVLRLSVPPGVPLTVVASAFESGELRYRGETSIPPLLPGLGKAVPLSLTPAAEQNFLSPVQVDITLAGARADRPSTGAVFADGNRKVLFWSAATNLVAGDSNETTDLFVRDLITGSIVNVHRGVNGEAANGVVGAGDINASGTLVVFSSAATNLAAAGLDSNGVSDVYLHDLGQDQTELLSVDKAGAPVAAASRQPAIPDDARWVFFESEAELTATAGERGIFRLDRTTKGLRFVGAGSRPRVSANGDSVVFWDAQAQALKLRDFLADVGREVIIVQPYHVASPSDPNVPELFVPYALSSDGKFITYAVLPTNGQSAAPGVYLYNHFAAGARSRLISTGTDGSILPVAPGSELFPSLSADGRFVVFALGTIVFVKDTITQELAQLSTPGTKATISDDGRLIAYTESASQNLFVIKNPIADVVPSAGTVPNVPFELVVTGSGQITALDGAVSCPGANCTVAVPRGALLTLNATPAAGFSFQGWSEGCSGTQNPLAVTVQQATRCVATFAQVRHSLTLTVAGGPNAGSVASKDGPPPTLLCRSTSATGDVCSATFPVSTNVTLVPTLAGTSNTVVWQGCDTDNGLQGCLVTMNRDRPVKAEFGTQSFTVTVGRAGTGEGTITSSDGNINCGARCQRNYIGNATVTLTAQAASSSVFTSWSGDCAGTNPTVAVTVTKVTSCTAAFTVLPRTLTVTKAGTGAGTVTSADNRINCGTVCRADFNSGTTVALTAVPAANSVFAGWTDGCTGSAAAANVLLDVNRTCTATFNLRSFALTVTKAGSGEGTVTSQPAGINCGGTCNANFNVGQSVTLTAAATAGSVFGGWTGACASSNANTATVLMDAVKTCGVTFTRQFELAVAFTGQGTGAVTLAPSGKVCTAACTELANSGATITLKAQPGANDQFGGWAGDCSASATDPTVASVTMNAAKNCTAQFLTTFPLAITKAGNGDGSVTSGDSRIDCGNQCNADYLEGTTVTLTASPLAGVKFVGWTGDCSGTALSFDVVISKAQQCTANFEFNTVALNQTAPASGATLLFNERVVVDFSYETARASGVVVTAVPLSAGAVTPGSTANETEPLAAGQGVGTVNFTVLTSANAAPVVVDAVRIVMRESAQSNVVVTQAEFPVNFSFIQLL